MSTRLLVAVAVLCAVGPALLVWALWPEAGGQAVADVQAGRPVPAMRGDYLAQMADAGVQLADPAPGVLPTSVEETLGQVPTLPARSVDEARGITTHAPALAPDGESAATGTGTDTNLTGDPAMLVARRAPADAEGVVVDLQVRLEGAPDDGFYLLGQLSDASTGARVRTFTDVLVVTPASVQRISPRLWLSTTTRQPVVARIATFSADGIRVDLSEPTEPFMLTPG